MPLAASSVKLLLSHTRMLAARSHGYTPSVALLSDMLPSLDVEFNTHHPHDFLLSRQANFFPLFFG